MKQLLPSTPSWNPISRWQLGRALVGFCLAMLTANTAFGQSTSSCTPVSGPGPGQIATIVTQPVEQYYQEDPDIDAELTDFANISNQTGLQIEYIGLECYSLDATASHAWSFQVPDATEVALRVQGSLTPGSVLTVTSSPSDAPISISASDLNAQGGSGTRELPLVTQSS